MTGPTYFFFVRNKEFNVELIHRGYEGALNNFLSLYFRCTPLEGRHIAVVIKLTDRTLNQWERNTNQQAFEGSDIPFCLKILPKLITLALAEEKQQIVIVFHRDADVYRSEGIVYFQAEATPNDTAKKYRFGENFTNKEIRQEILRLTYSYNQSKPHGFINKQELLNYLPITETEAERNVNYLVDGNYLKGPLTTAGCLVIKITKLGIDFFEEMESSDSTTQTPTPPSEPEFTSLYVKDEIIELIKKEEDGFNYKKLLQLIQELNFNHLSKNPYSALALIRAITDHIPPLLGYDNFEEVVNNYQGSRTDKDYLFRLLENRSVSDDSLHRPISKVIDLIDMTNLPNSLFLNRLLQECLKKTVTLGFKHKSQSVVKLGNQTKKVTDVSLRPLVVVGFTGITGGPDGYFVDLEFTNKGKGVALLSDFDFGGVPMKLNGKSLSEGERFEIKRIGIEGSLIRRGEVTDPTFVISYTNIDKVIFKTSYKIDLSDRDDKLKNIKSLSDPEFIQV